MSPEENNVAKAGNLSSRWSSSFADSIDRESTEEELLQLSSNATATVPFSTPSSALLPTTPQYLSISRTIAIPDHVKVARCLRLPEYGPRILFFSGGSAIKELSTVLKQYTHNSIHLITPFDSGGSSAEIRRALDMLSVGDLRNRILALSSDDLGHRHVVTLFSHRLSSTDEEMARTEFESIVAGTHVLCKAIGFLPMRRILMSHLRWFANRMPMDFDLRGASIGNLIITGCFLEHNRDIVTAIFILCNLLGVKGKVRPSTGANLHIRTLYDDGTEQVGQHLLGKHAIGKHGRIVHVDLVDTLQASSDDTSMNHQRQEPCICHMDRISSELVASSDILCFPMGSFFGSVLANLLPTGVGKAIVKRHCPKIYIPNTGSDPEMFGFTLTDCVQRIVDMVCADHKIGMDDEETQEESVEVPVERILNFVLVDTTHCDYCVDIDKSEIASKFGIVVLDICLVDEEAKIGVEIHGEKSQFLNPTKLAEVLVSFGS